jgi:hypothetical protein
MKDIDLGILENAEDDIVEELVPFSADEEAVMKRLFSMSEKKYNELIRHSDDLGEEKKEDEENIVREEPEETIVEGVEVYRRPAWHRPLCAAAAFLLIAGGVGTGFALNRSSKFSQVSEPASYEVTTEVFTEPATEPLTERALTEAEKKKLFEDLLPVFFESWSLNTLDHIDTGQDSLTFRYESLGEEFDATFYKMKDPRFSTFAGMCDYYDEYIISPETAFSFAGDVSDRQPGELIDECYFLEYNGELYARYVAKHAYSENEWKDDILSDRSFFASSGRFSWERIVKNQLEDGFVEAQALTVEFEKDDDGKWKVITGSIGGTEYDENRDYTGSEYPLVNEGPSFMTDEDIDMSSAIDNVNNYLEYQYNDSSLNYDMHWSMMTELPESYYHITDNFRNNNRWIRFVLDPYNGDGARRVIYTDGYGVVFGEEY